MEVNCMELSDIVAYVAIGVGITSIIIGILTFLISVLPARKLAKLQTVIQYFQQGDTKKFIECRHRVYEADKENIDPTDAAYLCSFFHFWGLMVRRKLLPIWVFDGVSGERVVELYQKLSEFIEKTRKDAPRYAEHFQWLSQRIVKKGYVRVGTLKKKGKV